MVASGRQHAGDEYTRAVLVELAALYLLAINVFTFLVYRHDALHRQRSGTNVALWKMLALPFFGGWVGASLANFIYGAWARRSFYRDWARLRYWPSICAFAHASLALSLLWGTRWLHDVAEDWYDTTGIFGLAFMAVNFLGFLMGAWTALTLDRWPVNRFDEPLVLRPLRVVAVAGGASGVSLAKILFIFGGGFTLGPASYFFAAAQVAGFVYVVSAP